MKRFPFHSACAILLLSAVTASCSKAEPKAPPIDYQKLCVHLVSVFPEKGRADFTQTCDTTYRRDLPVCRNSGMVAECLMNIKTWDDRIPCANECIMNSNPQNF